MYFGFTLLLIAVIGTIWWVRTGFSYPILVPVLLILVLVLGLTILASYFPVAGQTLGQLKKEPIAIVALLISLLVLWQEHLRPFQLDLRAAGRIGLAKNPRSEGLRQDCLFLDVILSNSGSRRGVIEDLAIVLRNGNESTLFRTIYEVLDRTENFSGGYPPPKMETFVGFDLAKNEDLVKRIMFVPHKNSDSFRFSATDYSLELWAKISAQTGWKRYEVLSLTPEANELANLEKTEAIPQPGGGYFVKWSIYERPFNVVEDRLRELREKAVVNQ